VALEDLIHPYLGAYTHSPQWVKSSLGWAYSRIPDTLRLGADHARWRKLASIRDPQALAAEAEQRLRTTLSTALKSVPAYRGLRDLGSRLDRPFEVLAQMPLVGKADIKRDVAGYLSVQARSRQRLESFTGGSTANPMRFYLQRHVSRIREYAFMAEFQARVGMRDGDGVLALRGRTVPTARHGGALWMHEPIKNQLILSSDHMQPQNLPAYVQALRRWRPPFIQAFPSALYPLAKWLAMYPAPDVTESIRGVMLYSETAYPHQIELFKSVFRCPVLMHYGHSERCVMGATLPDDDRYFFWPQYGHVELVDESGDAVTTPGASGEIVCTAFDNAVMPLVRYRTGDRGVLGGPGQQNLQGFPVLDRIEGRIQEMVKCRDGRLISITTLGAAHFNQLAGVTAIQFEQYQPGVLMLKVETAEALTAAMRRAIQRAVEDKTQGGCTVEVAEVASIPRTPAGKQLMLLQHLDLEREFAAPRSSVAPLPPRQALLADAKGLPLPVPMPRVVMIGTSLATQGGIAAVLAVYCKVPGFIGPQVDLIATHCDGTRWDKLKIAVAAWFKYMTLLVRGHVPLLHVHSSSGPSFWRKFMFILPTIVAGRPVVLHWHGGRFVSFFEKSPRWQQRLIGWTFARCDRVIALSEQWNDTLASMFPRARVTTVPNPVELPPQPAALSDSPATALFLGRVIHAKGAEDLLHAMPKVLEQVADGRLVLAGTGDLDAMQQLARRLDVEAATEFPGWVDGAVKAGLLGRASVFVLPSHAEAMPMAVLEAMAYGLPVVATRVGGIPQAVRDGIDGILIDAHDVDALSRALSALLGDAGLRRTMGASARRRVEENFAVDLIVPRIQTEWRAIFDARRAESRR
jgi:phenylacetate-CoA ligase